MIDTVTATTVQPVALRAGTPHALGILFRFARQFAILVAVWYAGTTLVQATGVPLPGNLVGMLLLLWLLHQGVVRLDHVQDVAALLVKHLNLFFIPVAVGLMAWGGLLSANGVGLALCLAGSAAVGLVAAGRTSQRLASEGVRGHA